MLFRFLNAEGTIDLHPVWVATDIPDVVLLPRERELSLVAEMKGYPEPIEKRTFHRITLLLPRYVHGPYEVLFVEANAFTSYRDLINRADAVARVRQARSAE